MSLLQKAILGHRKFYLDEPCYFYPTNQMCCCKFYLDVPCYFYPTNQTCRCNAVPEKAVGLRSI